MITTDTDNDMFVQKTGEKQLVCERECVCALSVYLSLCCLDTNLRTTLEHRDTAHWSAQCKYAFWLKLLEMTEKHLYTRDST